MTRSLPLFAVVLLASCRPEPSTAPGDATRDDLAAPRAPATPPDHGAAPTAAAPRSAADEALWRRLAEDVPDRNRTVIARRRAVRITADGEPIADGKDTPGFDEVEVIEVQGDRIRIVTRSLAGWARIAVWIDEADAAPQISRPATLMPDPQHTSKPEDGTIELAPGERIDVLERTATHAKVRTRDEAFTGWIEESKLSSVFVDEEFELPRFDADTMPSTPVSRTPGGKPFFTFSPMDNGTHPVRVTSSPRRGWLQIEHVDPCRRGVRVRGWVRAASTKIVGEQLMGFGCVGHNAMPQVPWGDLENAPKKTVPKDTELRSKDGVLVGRARGEVELREGADGAWRILTVWGPMPVVAKAPE